MLMRFFYGNQPITCPDNQFGWNKVIKTRPSDSSGQWSGYLCRDQNSDMVDFMESCTCRKHDSLIVIKISIHYQFHWKYDIFQNTFSYYTSDWVTYFPFGRYIILLIPVLQIWLFRHEHQWDWNPIVDHAFHKHRTIQSTKLRLPMQCLWSRYQADRSMVVMGTSFSHLYLFGQTSRPVWMTTP